MSEENIWTLDLELKFQAPESFFLRNKIEIFCFIWGKKKKKELLDIILELIIGFANDI